MNQCQLNLNVQERQYLADLLTSELKETQVEEHRTRSMTYREHIVEREEIIRGLLDKLSASEVAAAETGV